MLGINRTVLPISIPAVIPQTIGSFTYSHTLTDVSSYEGYTFAVYVHGSKQAILKFWHAAAGRISGRVALCREIKNHKILAEAKQNIDAVGSIQIPKFYDFHIAKDVVWMLTEYIYPLSAEQLNFDDYQAIREYFRQLGKLRLVREEIGQRSSIRFVVGFALAWLGVVIKGELKFAILYRLIKTYLAALPGIGRKQGWLLCHLDLRSDNVLYSFKGTYVIDFQSIAYAPETLDLAFSLDRALMHAELNQQTIAHLLDYVRSLSVSDRRAVGVYFSYGLLCDLLIDKENNPAENYQFLENIFELIALT